MDIMKERLSLPELRMDIMKLPELRRNIIKERLPLPELRTDIMDIMKEHHQRKKVEIVWAYLRMPSAKIPAIALTWAPEGKRKRGRPMLTWRRMVENERNQTVWARWSEVRSAAADRMR
ncbi:hypothetical protein CDAR_415331 [Caerostris darwini]|uniref:Uncharacterized protein n=1 Tax=Caerostris darwini TaxID=1538125 RepID=A0AAV4MLG0_9ARAC|nr:hypothetical protein CDAR_415331 [Caerostris darwini]